MRICKFFLSFFSITIFFLNSIVEKIRASQLRDKKKGDLQKLLEENRKGLFFFKFIGYSFNSYLFAILSNSTPYHFFLFQTELAQLRVAKVTGANPAKIMRMYGNLNFLFFYMFLHSHIQKMNSKQNKQKPIFSHSTSPHPLFFFFSLLFFLNVLLTLCVAAARCARASVAS